MSAPTVAQLLNLVDRAYRGPLSPAEVARLREGIEQLAAENAATRPSRRLTASRRLKNLKLRLRRLHVPMWRGGIEICRECSGWDGLRCRGAVTPYPCPTVVAVDAASPSGPGERVA